MRRIKNLRVNKDWTQRKLAEMSEVAPCYINRAEKWGSRMYPEQEKRVMAALGVSGDASQLYEEVNTDDLAIS